MEIEIVKYLGKDQPEDRKLYEILTYKPIAHPNSLLLVGDDKMHNEDASTNEYHEIFKVQFIASCKTTFNEKKNLLFAFYVGEFGELIPHLLSSLTGSYYLGGKSFTLIDYKSYASICELTGEDKLSFSEYFKEIKSGSLGTNTLLNIDDTLLNKDQQNEFYASQEHISSKATT
ncbi:hypothetical protein MUGA111182_00235 [Mucilaginibacter galii]|uniref:Uncharacterized protein n=1 Tax=Mucilaginibacter galii TaxID=2005073 RepID=A0A917J5L7_9SPHI|nr:hypothetical protein [Mucilaginibacter galii]GGI49119.1 hypothetical protein GCM10011425_03310 [Mucilaginibacter galii]